LTQGGARNGGGRPAALRASSVSRSFSGVLALDEVSLEVRPHEVVGLIGSNGAGKSTLVNVLSGFDVPGAGRVELDGEDVTGWSPHRRGRAGLARTFQHSRSFRELSVRENVELGALGCGAGAGEARARANELLDLLGLAAYAEAPLVARALATDPRYVLLDEPAAGLPEAEVPALAEVVRSVRDEHDAGVLLIDHNMTLVLEVCDRVHVLDHGRTLAEGTPAEIRASPEVTSAYLGESAVTADA
jgi:branched-chain amino acid transport system ATP-binding protein